MPPHAWLVFAAGLIAGTMNAAVGGGSFVSVPALIFAGVPAVSANQSSTVALFPGTFASTWAYRNELKPFEIVSTRWMLAVSLIGGFVGALLLLFTPAKIFDNLLPWLLLVGATVFAIGPHVGVVLRRTLRITPAMFLGVQFLLAIYGGYFGGAVGIMMMAAWSLLGPTDMKQLNAVKTLMVGTANAIAVLCFVTVGTVRWPQTLLMLVAGIIGGYGGARVTRLFSSQRIRAVATVFNFVMTAAFFWFRFAR